MILKLFITLFQIKKDTQNDFLDSFLIKTNTIILIRRKKKDFYSVEDVSQKKFDRQNKEKIGREFHNLESYIKQEKPPSVIKKSNLMSI